MPRDDAHGLGYWMRSLADDPVDTGHLDPPGADDFVTTVHDAARRGRFVMGLSMYAVVAVTPRAPVPTHPSGTRFGEDLSFLVRVAGTNTPTFVHTGVRTAHDEARPPPRRGVPRAARCLGGHHPRG